MAQGLFGEALPVSLDAQIHEIEREVRLRRRVYPRWVESGKIPQATADKQIEVMEAALRTLMEVREQKKTH